MEAFDDSPLDEDRQSATLDLGDEEALRERQAPAEILDRHARFYAASGDGIHIF